MTASKIFLSLFLISLSIESTALYSQSSQEILEKLKDLQSQNKIMIEEIDQLKSQRNPSNSAINSEPATIGGYGEIHYNQTDLKPGENKIDLHRFVLYLGKRFDDWVQLHSELEIEHGFVVGGEESGEVAMEQLYLEFLLSDLLNVKAGRFLAPMGRTNLNHEPTSFNSVERSYVDKVLIPTTWSVDGLSLFGSIVPSLSYDIGLVAGLDGSGATASEGLRETRQEKGAQTDHWAGVGQIRWTVSNALQVGLSGFHGSLANGTARTLPSSLATTMLAFDAQYSISIVDINALYVQNQIQQVNKLNTFFSTECANDNNSESCDRGTIASRMSGYNTELALHLLPDSFKTKRLTDGDLVLFCRYDHVDTQERVSPSDLVDKQGRSQEVTSGLRFSPNKNVALKADVQQFKSENQSKTINKFNLGLGWML